MKEFSYPLNSLEKQMLAYENEDFAFNSHLIMDLKSPLDLVRVRTALQVLFEKIPILRSHLEMKTSKPRRVASESCWFDPVQYLTIVDSAEMDDLHDDLNRPFDATIEPPLRVYYGPRKDGGWRWIMTTHHIAMDGMGQASLLNEFFHAYDGQGITPWAEKKKVLRFRGIFLKHIGLVKTLKLFISSFLYIISTTRPKAAGMLDHPEVPTRKTKMIALPLGEKWALWDQHAKTLGLQNAFEFLLYILAQSLDEVFRARGDHSQPLVFAIPLNFRPFLRVKGHFHNYAGLCKLVIPRAVIDSAEFPTWLRAQIKKDVSLPGALPSIFLGPMAHHLLSFQKIKNFWKRNSLDPAAVYTTALVSVGRLPNTLDYPDSLKIEKIYGFGSLTKSPGFGVIVTGEKANLTLTLEYLEGLIELKTIEKLLASLTSRFRDL